MKRILTNTYGKTEIFHFAEHDDTAAIETVIDTQALKTHVQKMKYHAKKSEVTNYVGSVDMTLFRKWFEKKGIGVQEAYSDNKYMIQYLNDPDNAHFKAVDGKI